MLDFVKFSIFCSSLRLVRLCRKNSDFAMVLGAVGVGHSCSPYLGTFTQLMRDVEVGSVLQT